MKVIVPMAGTGDRFVRKGYSDPKPLIKINNKPIVQFIIEMFDPTDEFIFICNNTHLQTTNMEQTLKSLVPSAKILSIPNHKKGPVFTILDTDYSSYIGDDEEIIVCYVDNPYLWDYSHFKSWVKTNDSDGCILSHQGFHPHRLSPTFMAHIQENNLNVLEIKEKEPYTNDPISEHASTGTYYFKKGKYIKEYFQKLMDLNLHYNGEFYITLVYNLLIKDNLKVHAYPTEFVSVFGTPEEVENFQAWQTILEGIQVKNEEDLIKCYRYWKNYNSEKQKLEH